MWRFYADILNDLATSVDLIAPFFKHLLLPIACISNLCRSIVGVAGGSTRAALTQHQAIAHNMGDVIRERWFTGDISQSSRFDCEYISLTYDQT